MTAHKVLTLAVATVFALTFGEALAAPSGPETGVGCGAPEPALLAAILPPVAMSPAPGSAAPAEPSQPIFAAAMAFCQANCLYGPDVSCSGSSCSAKDDPNGYVVCDGDYTLCRRPACSNGTVQWVNSGCCCSPGIPPKQRSVERVCVDGQWQYTGRFGCAGGCSGSCLEP